VAVSIPPEQAAELIVQRWESLCGIEVPELWSSPWARARKVAEALGHRWGCEPRLDARLSELGFGVWEGRRFDDIERDDRERFERWMRAFPVEAAPQGETVGEMRRRLVAWAAERQRTSRTALAITHAGIIRMARAASRGLSYGDVASQVVEHLSPERVHFPPR
jgi:broad specificity phosphatase PhoE